MFKKVISVIVIVLLIVALIPAPQALAAKKKKKDTIATRSKSEVSFMKHAAKDYGWSSKVKMTKSTSKERVYRFKFTKKRKSGKVIKITAYLTVLKKKKKTGIKWTYTNLKTGELEPTTGDLLIEIFEKYENK